MRRSEGPAVVRLPAPIPVHVIYATAWVAEDGTLNLRDDVYGRDAALIARGNGAGPG